MKELVRYIHQNPLRAELVKNLVELGSYPYSGHFVLMGKMKRDWQNRNHVPRYSHSNGFCGDVTVGYDC